jgi:hypothetical protein
MYSSQVNILKQMESLSHYYYSCRFWLAESSICFSLAAGDHYR